jgi:hypothetical protein
MHRRFSISIFLRNKIICHKLTMMFQNVIRICFWAAKETLSKQNINKKKRKTYREWVAPQNNEISWADQKNKVCVTTWKKNVLRVEWIVPPYNCAAYSTKDLNCNNQKVIFDFIIVFFRSLWLAVVLAKKGNNFFSIIAQMAQMKEKEKRKC